MSYYVGQHRAERRWREWWTEWAEFLPTWPGLAASWCAGVWDDVAYAARATHRAGGHR